MEGPFSLAETALFFEGGMGGLIIFFWGFGSTTVWGSSSSRELVLDGDVGGVGMSFGGSSKSTLT